MKTLKILIPWSNTPDASSGFTLIMKNIINSLKKRIDVQVLWLTCLPEKLNLANSKYEDYIILDIHDYENALDFLNQEKTRLDFCWFWS